MVAGRHGWPDGPTKDSTTVSGSWPAAAWAGPRAACAQTASSTRAPPPARRRRRRRHVTRRIVSSLGSRPSLGVRTVRVANERITQLTITNRHADLAEQRQRHGPVRNHSPRSCGPPSPRRPVMPSCACWPLRSLSGRRYSRRWLAGLPFLASSPSATPLCAAWRLLAPSTSSLARDGERQTTTAMKHRWSRRSNGAQPSMRRCRHRDQRRLVARLAREWPIRAGQCRTVRLAVESDAPGSVLTVVQN
jgi:hypothetical protein